MYSLLQSSKFKRFSKKTKKSKTKKQQLLAWWNFRNLGNPCSFQENFRNFRNLRKSGSSGNFLWSCSPKGLLKRYSSMVVFLWNCRPKGLLKRDSNTVIFLWNLRNFNDHPFFYFLDLIVCYMIYGLDSNISWNFRKPFGA